MVRALSVISFFAVSGFLTISLNYAWSESEKSMITAKKGLKYLDEGDVERGKLWLERAANRGDVAAQFILGVLLYAEGDIEQAKHWLKQAASRNNRNSVAYTAAQLYMGIILYFYEGNVEQGILWLEQVASRNKNKKTQIMAAYEQIYLWEHFFSELTIRATLLKLN